MSGFEIAGVVLGAFPLIISGLEHWREVATVGGFFWRVRNEYKKCRRDVEFHQIVYKRNLKELLLPIIKDEDEITRLVGDPRGKDWSSKVLQERLKERLQESFDLYMEIITDINETAIELRKELSLDKETIQRKLISSESKQRRPISPQPPSQISRLASAKSKWDYETFRLRFSFNEQVREELFDRLTKCNERLKTLLGTSDKISTLQNATPTNKKQVSALETIFKRARKMSDLLFKSLQEAWQCSCQQYHFANLRLEHRTLPDICFEIVLVFVAPSSQLTTPWSWRELQCGQMIGCSLPYILMEPHTAPLLYTSPTVVPPPSIRRKKEAFITPVPTILKIKPDIQVKPDLKLCQLLGSERCNKCMGIVGYDDEMYHLHPFTKRKQPNNTNVLTLDQILSSDIEAHLTRRQRYSIALIVASSVAQLQFTDWLRTGLTKENVIFFPWEDDHGGVSFHEPFIRQGFSIQDVVTSNTEVNDCNFHSLGIILLELCFGQRLEDHPLRKKYTAGAGELKESFDLLAAVKWCQSVGDEGGDDYASAVKWCFLSANNANRSWQSEIIKNVIRPLELCQKHFQMATVS